MQTASARAPRPDGRALAGFTLIELLVVIAIIAILAAILFPVFAQARAKARQSSCLSNEKQIALAIIQYQQDYDETLPLATIDIAAATNIYEASWVSTVQPYAKNLGIFVCPDAPYDALDGTPSENPADSGPISNVFSTATRKNMGGPTVSYGIPTRLEVVDGVRSKTNYTISGAGYGVPASIGSGRYQGLGGYVDPTGSGKCGIGLSNYVIPSYSNAEVARPAQTVLVQDNNMWDGGGCGGFISQPRGRHVREQRAAGGFPQGFVNVAFMDGHVKAMKPEMLYAKTADPAGDFFTYFWPFK
jgi:prepilin-type N-terminal cleavage/methylation domain-containing protein/prepilin-type processing-associated H-X9-DG protein